MSDLDKKDFDANDLEVGKQRLREALLRISEDYLENVELAPKEEVRYSPKLEKNMAKLMKNRKRAWYKYFNTTCKRVAAACLASCVLIGALMSCKPIREPIVEFLKNAYEQFTEFWLPEETDIDAPCFIEEAHTFTYIPDGYELTEKQYITGKDFVLKTVWEDNDGNKIVLFQMTLSTKLTFDSENTNSEICNVGDLEILLIKRDNLVRGTDEWYAVWKTDEYAYSALSQDVSKENVIEMIKSLGK